MKYLVITMIVLLPILTFVLGFFLGAVRGDNRGYWRGVADAERINTQFNQLYVPIKKGD